MQTKAEQLSEVRRLTATGQARRIRVAALLSTEDVADTIGVHHSTVARWERGERAPKGAHALEYAQLLLRLQAGNAA